MKTTFAQRAPLIIVILSMLSIAFTACKKADEVPEPMEEEIECPYTDAFIPFDNTGINQTGLIPLNINNYWVYADSSWDNDGVFLEASIDTVRPIATEISGSDIWWKFNVAYLPFKAMFQKNDSIYILTPPDLGIGCHSKSLRYYDIEMDTLYDGVFEYGYGRMRKTHWVTGITSTPAGDFTDCYLYSLQDESGDYYELLKPTIGFVKYRINNYDLGYSEKTLIAYYIM